MFQNIKKALSWAQRNGYKSDIENLKREIAEEQAKLMKLEVF